LDVYGENVRVIVPIDTEQFGRMIVVCVGAMMVGSTVITAKKGQKVRRTDELGYFKFGVSPSVTMLTVKVEVRLFFYFNRADSSLMTTLSPIQANLWKHWYVIFVTELTIASSGSEYWTSSSYCTSSK
jgi:hypothetical protein